MYDEYWELCERVWQMEDREFSALIQSACERAAEGGGGWHMWLAEKALAVAAAATGDRTRLDDAISDLKDFLSE